GSYAYASGDSYDACRLLLPARIGQHQVKGDVIAMVPNRDSLFHHGFGRPGRLGIHGDDGGEVSRRPTPAGSHPHSLGWRCLGRLAARAEPAFIISLS